MGARAGQLLILTGMRSTSWLTFLLRWLNLDMGRQNGRLFISWKGQLRRNACMWNPLMGGHVFKQCNSSFQLCTPIPLAMVRSDCAHQEVIADYFTLSWSKRLWTHLNFRLANFNAYIYNIDKLGKPFDAKQLKWVALRVLKKVHGQSSSNKMQITVVVYASAPGNVIPPNGNIQRRVV